MEKTKVVAEHAQMEKLNRLEREYLVLTHTQSKAEVRTTMDSPNSFTDLAVEA